MSTRVKLLYEARQLPIFQNRMYRTEMEARDCPKGNIHLVEDLETGLIYNQAFQPNLMCYGEDYQNEQAVSPIFRAHLESVARIVVCNLGRHSLIEIGCGKGFFLEMLLSNGCEVTGFDPTYEGINPNVIKQYFVPGLGIQAQGLVLRHVLEHIQDPVDFLMQIRKANGGSGRIYIEVPCFDWICEQRAWFDIFYEHVNYFRLSDFQRMFGMIHDSGHLFGGQYLYVVAELESLKVPIYDPFCSICFPGNFQHSLESFAQHSTAQHSTAQHSTAQRSGRYLGRRI